MRDSAILRTHELGDYWQSKIDESFICHVGEEKFFEDRGISELIQNHAGVRHRANIGYAPYIKKWFAWTIDLKEIASICVDEISNDYERQPKYWKSFGFDGAKQKIKDIAASHSLLGKSK